MRIARTVATAASPPARGFPRWAWWTAFLATFMFAVPLSSPWWSKGLRSEIPESPDDEGEPKARAEDGGLAPAQEGGDAPMLKIVLHTRIPDKSGLATVERSVPYVKGVAAQIQAAVAELAVASAGAPALLPEGVRVLDCAFSKAGTVYIDFSSEIEAGRSVGAEEERLLVGGIVRTITDNFSAVRRVVILVDGRVPRPGHLDLSRSLRRDDPSLAADPEPEPEPTTPAGASPPAVPQTPSSVPSPPSAAKSPPAPASSPKS